jgi:glutathione-regulated potassium-efflux system ancillary protein KefG
MQKNRVLILFAHPSVHRSEANLPLFQASQGLDHVSVVDLYQEYPNYAIDIEREQQRLRDHDAVVFMFPLYWYSTPSLLKEWQDLVLEYDFAYGKCGTALHGKLFMCALTAGGAEKAYHADGYNHFTIRELLQPLEQMANLTGMHYLPPFALFGARTASEERRLATHVSAWIKLLDALVDGSVDPQNFEQAITINDYVETLKEGGA